MNQLNRISEIANLTKDMSLSDKGFSKLIKEAIEISKQILTNQKV